MTSAEYTAQAQTCDPEWALVYAVLAVAAAIREAAERKTSEDEPWCRLADQPLSERLPPSEDGF